VKAKSSHLEYKSVVIDKVRLKKMDGIFLLNGIVKEGNYTNAGS
jgi:hypothetical protein